LKHKQTLQRPATKQNISGKLKPGRGNPYSQFWPHIAT
jgi:hypothetical protein